MAVFPERVIDRHNVVGGFDRTKDGVLLFSAGLHDWVTSDDLDGYFLLRLVVCCLSYDAEYSLAYLFVEPILIVVDGLALVYDIEPLLVSYLLFFFSPCRSFPLLHLYKHVNGVLVILAVLMLRRDGCRDTSVRCR